jgi:hypothetical protein
MTDKDIIALKTGKKEQKNGVAAEETILKKNE